MIYVYDILLNWNKDIVYDFFEWEKNDSLEHIKKIPLFRTTRDTIINITKNRCKIEKEFIKKIYNVTESYALKKIKKIPYAMIICDGELTLAIKLDSDGNIKYKSKLLIDEENETLCITKKLNISQLNYDIYEQLEEKAFLTRSENDIRLYLIKQIEDSYNEKKYDKLRYLYSEYTGNKETNIENIYKNLKFSLKNNIDDNHYYLYNLLQLSTNKN